MRGTKSSIFSVFKHAEFIFDIISSQFRRYMHHPEVAHLSRCHATCNAIGLKRYRPSCEGDLFMGMAPMAVTKKRERRISS